MKTKRYWISGIDNQRDFGLTIDHVVFEIRNHVSENDIKKRKPSTEQQNKQNNLFVSIIIIHSVYFVVGEALVVLYLSKYWKKINDFWLCITKICLQTSTKTSWSEKSLISLESWAKDTNSQVFFQKAIKSNNWSLSFIYQQLYYNRWWQCSTFFGRTFC